MNRRFFMFKNLFKPASPLLGWFILMEAATGLCIVGYWIEFFLHGAKPWQPGPGAGVLFTGLYAAANILMFRNRWLAAICFATSWLIMILTLSAF
jgi:hypothetical protein